MTARAHCAYARASIYLTTGHRDEYRASFAEAQRLWIEEGLDGLAAEETVLACLSSGRYQAGQYLTSADIRELLAPLMRSTGLVPLARRHVLLMASILERESGDPREASRLHTEASGLRGRRRDIRRLIRQYRAAGIPRRRSALELFDRLLTLNAGGLRGMSLFSPTSAPAIAASAWAPSPARDLALRGLLLWGIGRRENAELLLLEAVRLLKKSDQQLTAFYVLLELGRSQCESAPAKAVRHLMAAAETYETLRERVIDDALRAQSAEPMERLMTMLIELLLADGGATGTDTPGAEAFGLVERARSRGLLELLGTTVPPVATAPPELLDQEAAAKAEVAERRVALALDGGERAVVGLREALDRLAGVQERIAGLDVAGEEYVSLSRGTPPAFTEVKELLRAEDGR